MSPPGEPGWIGAWMTVDDVFHIRGRGTVVTGRLQGSVQLNTGDTLVCDGARWAVIQIEQFKATLPTAQPGANIGVLLNNGPPADVLRGRTVKFESGVSPGGFLQPKKRRWRG